MNIFSYLALFVIVMVFRAGVNTPDVRSEGPPREAAVRFTPVEFDPAGFAPLRLAGAWEVEVDDARFGGVSGLAMDGQALVAVTDSGTVIRLPMPGRGDRAFVSDLPSGPGIPQFKMNRDSEAVVRDPAGRGWWIAFEQRHQLWLYDPGFRRALAKIDLGEKRWRRNRGIEAMVADGDGLSLFPEGGAEWLQIEGDRMRVRTLTNRQGDITDAIRLPDGRLLFVTRKFGLNGIAKHLVEAEGKSEDLAIRAIARLGLDKTDNVEAVAAGPRADGGTRLWLMTDNDFRPRKATVLVALDLP